MAIIYDDANRPAFSGRPIPYDQQDAVGAYLRHFENQMYLSFIANNSDRSLEKLQAASELKICERKLAHWARHPNYDRRRVEEGVAAIKRKWRSSR